MLKCASRSRIPCFGGANTKTPEQQPAPTKPPAKDDLGKHVRVDDKIGILRYIGNVHFAVGVWCGLELIDGMAGKNDGSVRGVRYFQCGKHRGLMTPLAKVTLVQEEDDESSSSGPHSILYEEKDKEDSRPNETYGVLQSSSSSGEGVMNNTRCISNNDRLRESPKNSTYSLPEQEAKHNATIVVSNNVRLSTISTDCCKNTTKLLFSNKSQDSADHNATIIVSNNMRVGGKNTTKVLFSSPDISSTKSPSLLELSVALRQKPIVHSTPVLLSKQYDDTPAHFIYDSLICCDDDDNSANNKRNSLDFEESLGILTPDQMRDANGLVLCRSPSMENINTWFPPSDSHSALYNAKSCGELSELSASLGIIDEKGLISSAFNNIKSSETAALNLLPFDSTRIAADQTPSPEELPLDTTPVLTCSDDLNNTVVERKSVNTSLNSTVTPTSSTGGVNMTSTSSSFVASIISITSLDTGYQGDGEMSRPGSRGADNNSPLTRRPLLPRQQQQQQQQTRVTDPMTDSDFYTESDADHEEQLQQLQEQQQLRGDRRAQVIDGTLYGVDPQAAADIYANNRENMDSSGVFTDIESSSSPAGDETLINRTIVASPSDSSTQTISDDSQNNVIVHQNNTPTNDTCLSSTSTIINNNSTSNSTNTSTTTTIVTTVKTTIASSNNNVKKSKIDVKSGVATKVSTVGKVINTRGILTESSSTNANVKQHPKAVNKWDAVMNRISKGGESAKSGIKSLKDVKARVYNTSTLVNKSPEVRKQSPTKQYGGQKAATLKPRRILRTRTSPSTTSNSAKNSNNVESSINSSLSDLSGSSPAKKNGSLKQPRTPNPNPVKLSPRSTTNSQGNNNLNNNKNTITVSPVSRGKASLAASKTSPADKEKKIESVNKEVSRKTVLDTSGVDGNVSQTASSKSRLITTPPQQQQQPPQQQQQQPCCRTTTDKSTITTELLQDRNANRTAEALAILVQHLVFTVEAFKTPLLKSQVTSMHNDIEATRIVCNELKESLREQSLKYSQTLENERSKSKKDLTQLKNSHRDALNEVNEQKHDIELAVQTLNKEMKKLQRIHEEQLDILREENDAIRDQLDERGVDLQRLQQQLTTQSRNNNAGKSPQHQHQHNHSLHSHSLQLETENGILVSSNTESQQEVQSLRAVLDLKQAEVSELRKALAEAVQKSDRLPMVEERLSSLTARCEDLQLQLERKNEHEVQMLTDMKKLSESYKEESNQKRRLSQHNEELQWKLKQNKEVISKVLEQAAEETQLTRSQLTASFSEKGHHHHHHRDNRDGEEGQTTTTSTTTSGTSFGGCLDRSYSFRGRTNSGSYGENSLLNISSSSSISSIITPPSSAPLTNLLHSHPPPPQPQPIPCAASATSPKVKGVVHKSDSVSYMLEMEESPEVVASRIVRRSFRTSPSSSAGGGGSSTVSPAKSAAAATVMVTGGGGRVKCVTTSCTASSTPIHGAAGSGVNYTRSRSLMGTTTGGGGAVTPVKMMTTSLRSSNSQCDTTNQHQHHQHQHHKSTTSPLHSTLNNTPVSSRHHRHLTDDDDDEDEDDDDLGVFWQCNKLSSTSATTTPLRHQTITSTQPPPLTTAQRHLITNYRQLDDDFDDDFDDDDEEDNARLLMDSDDEANLKTHEDDISDEDLVLPALPSNGGTVLPPPRHLAPSSGQRAAAVNSDSVYSEEDDECSTTSSATSSAGRL